MVLAEGGKGDGRSSARADAGGIASESRSGGGGGGEWWRC